MAVAGKIMYAFAITPTFITCILMLTHYDKVTTSVVIILSDPIKLWLSSKFCDSWKTVGPTDKPNLAHSLLLTSQSQSITAS